MPTLWQQLVAVWRNDGLKIRPGVDSAEIQRFEQTYNIILPTDLRDYFLTVDGMEDELDSALNRFWPLAMMRPVSDELKDIHPDRWAYPGCFVFADHCIWCFAWAVRLGKDRRDESDSVVQLIGGGSPGPIIAPSFTRFVEMYLRDPYSVL